LSANEHRRRASDLVARASRGEIAAIGQLITGLESGSPLAKWARRPLHERGGNAHIVGVTGAPGTGKSTLVGALAKELRARGQKVGVIAVDPSSSISGGSILGDRIRMQEHTLDVGMFMRSMSSRGCLGGVSRATVDAVAVLDASGWDVVVVETVGVGQAEVEIVQIAHTTIVVSVPGLGDDVQAIKAGLLEVADVHVVNKVDRPDANKTMSELLSMLMLGGGPVPGGWAVPVLGTGAHTGTGVPELADALAEHMAWLRNSNQLEVRERAAAGARVRAIAKDLLIGRFHDPPMGSDLDLAIDDVVARRVDPHTAALRLLELVAVSS
jgi:LAO/AO transport system kinase